DDADDLAGEQAVAGDLDLGVRADEMAILAGDAELELDRFAGLVGAMDGLDLAGVHALDADAGADLDAVDVAEADENANAAAAPARALVENKQSGPAKRERGKDEKAEQDRLGAREITRHE